MFSALSFLGRLRRRREEPAAAPEPPPVDAGERRSRALIAALPDPAFLLDAQGTIVAANPAASEFLVGTPAEGRHLLSVLRAPAVFEAAEDVSRNLFSRVVDFQLAGPVERSCRAFLGPIDEKAPSGTLLLIRDLTDERRIERLRSDFIANASHELRTPIASLLGFVETLRGSAKDDAGAREKFLDIMLAQALRMQRLVADLMSLSRIEMREHVPPEGEVDLGEIAREAGAAFEPILNRTGAILDFEDAGEKLVVVGDRDEIYQAAQNLLDNAAKYGGDPALIKLRVGKGSAPSLGEAGDLVFQAGDSAAQIAARRSIGIDDLVYLQVRDFGPGIEREDLPRITERFYRASVERSRKAGGTGLGLAIVKHTLSRHKGGLHVESRPGAGAAFTCYFAARKP
jgi:two-component system phosphate regulon sensor histidine kinase PhoR